MKIVFWLLGAGIVALALSVPITARAAELSSPEVGAFERGLLALEQGDVDGALEQFRAVSRRHPEYARALRHAGELLADERGDTGAGVSFVNASLLADPFSGETWGAWGRLHLQVAGLGR